MSTFVVLNGVVYKSKKAAYAAYNVTSSTVDYRVRVLGMSLEEAITADPGCIRKMTNIARHGVPVVCGDTKYESMRAFAEYLDMPTTSVYQALREGVRPDELEKSAWLKRKFGVTRLGRRVIVNGVEYPSKDVACREYRVSKSSVEDKIRLGMTFEEAINSLRPFGKFAESYRLICDERFCVLVCTVCGKTVLLPIYEAKLFKHSDLCDKYEWKEG